MLNDLQKRFLENVYDESADDWSIEYVLVEIKKDQLDRFHDFIHSQWLNIDAPYWVVIRENSRDWEDDIMYRWKASMIDIATQPCLPKKWICVSFDEFMNWPTVKSLKRHTYEKKYVRDDGMIFEKDSITENNGWGKHTIKECEQLEKNLLQKARVVRWRLNSHKALKF